MNDYIKKYINDNESSLKRFTIKSNARIIDDKIVIKKKDIGSRINDIYNYLDARSFNYYPKLIDSDDDFEVYPFIRDSNEPIEQKAMDIMYLLSLLHSKTTFYRELDIDHNKKIYEEVNEKLDYLYNYYNDLIDLIEKEVYMSPSGYLIARNINIIFNSIYYAKDGINNWYKKIENNKNERVCQIHNNVKVDHYIKSEKSYLISWNKSTIDNPIYDLLSFYRNHYLDFDFSDLFHYYESSYPLKEEERTLLFTYMAIPPKIEVEKDEYKMCIKINKIIDYLYKTSNLIMNYHG